MSEIKLIKKWICNEYYVDKPLQIDKYALYEKDGISIGQVKLVNLKEIDDIVEVVINITAYDSFDRIINDFNIAIARSNNHDSNITFGDRTPIFIKGKDVDNIVPKIIEYKTLNTSITYENAKKIKINRDATFYRKYGHSAIETINNKFKYQYHIMTYSKIPSKIDEGVMIDIDGNIKSYEGNYPYLNLNNYLDSDEFKEQIKKTKKLQSSIKGPDHPMIDSSKRKECLKNNKKVLIMICLFIIVIPFGINSYHKYNELHNYDGMWHRSSSYSDDYISISSNKVTFYQDLIDDSDLYEKVYYGKIKDGKIILNSGKEIETWYHSSYYIYTDKDYEKMYDVDQVYPIKVIDKNTIEVVDYEYVR